MAGPFALPGNTAREIAPIKLAGGAPAGVPDATDPTLGAIEAATEAVKVVGQLNTQRLEREAVSGVSEDIKAVRDALQINKHPNLAQSFFSKESLQDPYIQNVYSRFTEIQSAVKQGRLSHEYGLERMEAIMSEAVSRRPQFADSIRKAANDTAGANITSKLFTQIMSQSPQQAVDLKLQQEAARLGLPVEVYQGYLQQDFLRQQDMSAMQWRKERGAFTANDLANQIRIGVSSVTENIQGEILAQLQQGGVQDVEQMKALARARFTELRNLSLSGLPTSVDGSVINGHISTLDKEEERVLEMIEDGSMAKVAKLKRELGTELALADFREQAPEISKLFDVLGRGEGAIRIISTWTKYKSNPQAFQGLYATEQGGALTLGAMLLQNEQAAQVVNGERPAANPQEARLAGFQSALRLKHDVGTDNAPDPQETLRLVDAISNAGLEYSTITLADPQVAQAVKQYKETWGQVVNHYNSDVAALQTKYDDLKRKGVFVDGDLEIVNGGIAISGARRSAKFGAGNFGVDNSMAAEVNTFIRQANQTLRMGQTYKGNGVFPNTVFSNANSYLSDMISGGAQVPEETQGGEDVITFDFDSSGNLIRVE